MKYYGEPVLVRTDAGDRPLSMLWRRRIYRIKAIEEIWRWRGKWWATPRLKGHKRIYFRVSCTSANGSALSLEIYREYGQWVLSRVLD